MNTIRTFIAIPMPPDLKELVSGIQEDCGKHPGAISWVKTKNIHLTLKFLGDIPEEKIGPVEIAIGEGAKDISSFIMQTGDPGVFPNIRNPRVMWIGLKDETGAIYELEKRISAELNSLGVLKGKKNFSPHITLARVRSPKGRKIVTGLLRSGKTPGPIEIPVNQVNLYKSDLKPAGAVHSVLSSFELKVTAIENS